jgi:hypothetical protein
MSCPGSPRHEGCNDCRRVAAQFETIFTLELGQISEDIAKSTTNLLMARSVGDREWVTDCEQTLRELMNAFTSSMKKPKCLLLGHLACDHHLPDRR